MNRFEIYRTSNQYTVGDKMVPTIAYYAKEKYVMIPRFPGFWIGNYGSVYSEAKVGQLAQYDNRGYRVVSIYDAVDQKWKAYPVHRLVMMAHCPIPNPNEMQVNHIDGVTTNNIYLPGTPQNNLEWVTSLENVQHAVRTGLLVNPRGEDHPEAIYTEEQVRAACQALQEGASRKQAIEAAGLPYCVASLSFINSIKFGKTWAHISKEYEMERTQDRHTEEEIRMAFELLSKGFSDDAVSMEMQKYGYRIKPAYVRELRNCRIEKWKDIALGYRIPVMVQKFEFTDEEMEKICTMIIQGFDHYQIQVAMRLTDRPLKSVSAFLRSLQSNKNKTYQHITSRYFPDNCFISRS